MGRAERNYYAVPDPATGDMTYWTETARGQLQAWPTRPKPPRYGPKEPAALLALPFEQRLTALRDWYATVLRPWRQSVEAAIAANPDIAKARFAALTSRCCVCGRVLTDEASKVWGMGPDCRGGLHQPALEAAAWGMGRVHAEAEARRAASAQSGTGSAA